MGYLSERGIHPEGPSETEQRFDKVHQTLAYLTVNCLKDGIMRWPIDDNTVADFRRAMTHNGIEVFVHEDGEFQRLGGLMITHGDWRTRQDGIHHMDNQGRSTPIPRAAFSMPDQISTDNVNLQAALTLVEAIDPEEVKPKGIK